MNLREDIKSEFVFRTSRSAGPGGQGVNKTETRVEVGLDILNSPSLDQLTKEILAQKLATRLNNDGTIWVAVQDTRSQLDNKELGISRLFSILDAALKSQKPRKKTRPTRSSQLKRLSSKKNNAQKKLDRQPPKD